MGAWLLIQLASVYYFYKAVLANCWKSATYMFIIISSNIIKIYMQIKT